MASERLQKILSQRGLASRREAETWIRAGRVRVNGAVVVELGTRADPDTDRIEVDGNLLPETASAVTVVLNKPAGYITTVRDPHADRTVMDLVLGVGQRVYPIGRLDKDTRGVLLLTNDGELANSLLHPKGGVEKVYEVTTASPLKESALDRLTRGVDLAEGRTAPTRLWGVEHRGGRTYFKIALREGKKRQIRLMVQQVGSDVVDLRRVAFAGITAKGVSEGTWRRLGEAEVDKLRRAAKGISPRRRRAPAAKGAAARPERKGKGKAP